MMKEKKVEFVIPIHSLQKSMMSNNNLEIKNDSQLVRADKSNLQESVPILDIKNINIDKNLIEIFTIDYALKFRAIPIQLSGNKIIIAMENPFDEKSINEICLITGIDVEVIATINIEEAIKIHYNI